VATNNLLYEAGLAALDFSSSPPWCIGPVWDTNPFFDLAHWLVKLVFAYDYIRSAVSAGNRTTLDTWFLNMGVYWESVLDQQTSSNFANSRQDQLTDFALSGGGTTASTTLGTRTYCGGPFDNGLSGKYQNRMTSFANLVTQIGVMLNQAGVSTTTTAHLITMGKRYFMEWMQFGIMADGMPLEFERGIEDGNKDQGWRYATGTAGAIGEMADAIARTGDTSLYAYSTSAGAGSGGNSTAGGPKTLFLIHQQLARYINQTETGAPRYAKDDTVNCSVGNLLIDPGSLSNRDTFLAMSNLYYQDISAANNIKSEYMRTAASAPAYPASPEGGGYYVWGGDSGRFPGVLFMFGQNEGVVDPYP
jgi:hypothetical protein